MSKKTTKIKFPAIARRCAAFGFRYCGPANIGKNWHTLVHAVTSKPYHVHVRRDRLPAVCVALFDQIRRGTAPVDGMVEAF